MSVFNKKCSLCVFTLCKVYIFFSATFSQTSTKADAVRGEIQRHVGVFGVGQAGESTWRKKTWEDRSKRVL